MSRYALDRYNLILAGEPEMMNKARIRLLAQALIAFIIQRTVLACFLLSQENNVPFWRSVILLALFITGLLLLLSGKTWKVAGHFFVISVSLMIWSSLIFFEQDISLIALQYTLIILSGAYYILGTRWGLIYSLINILPLIVFALISNYTGVHPTVMNQKADTHVLNFVLIYNFILLLFIHFYFFKAFKRTNTKELEYKADLRKSLEAAENIASAKTNFLATMSHELRTPLNAVVGMANVLLMDDLKTEQRKNLEILRFAAENQMAIINDILDFNRIEAGDVQLQMENFRLDVLLKNVYGAATSQAEAKMIGLQLNIDPKLDGLVLTGDAMRLTQILFNLIGNAVKFTTKGSVRFECRRMDTKGDHVNILFKIMDTGIGIPIEQQATLFKPYAQNKARTSRQCHGTGLGLTIASRLVALQGGELRFSSKEGQGTTFSFELSYKLAIEDIPTALEINVQNSPSSLSNLHVLVAEDNQINIMVIKKLLKNWGVTPVIVENGKEAVEAVVSGDYHVILMDINMPIMDGFEASKKIRELLDAKKSSIHIIALTASVGVSIEQHESYQYLDDCVLKPFKPEQLKEKLERLCKNSQP